MRFTLYSTAVSLFGIAGYSHAITVLSANDASVTDDQDLFESSELAQRLSTHSAHGSHGHNGAHSNMESQKLKAAATVDQIRSGVRALQSAKQIGRKKAPAFQANIEKIIKQGQQQEMSRQMGRDPVGLGSMGGAMGGVMGGHSMMEHSLGHHGAHHRGGQIGGLMNGNMAGNIGGHHAGHHMGHQTGHLGHHLDHQMGLHGNHMDHHMSHHHSPLSSQHLDSQMGNYSNGMDSMHGMDPHSIGQGLGSNLKASIVQQKLNGHSNPIVGVHDTVSNVLHSVQGGALGSGCGQNGLGGGMRKMPAHSMKDLLHNARHQGGARGLGSSALSGSRGYGSSHRGVNSMRGGLNSHSSHGGVNSKNRGGINEYQRGEGLSFGGSHHHGSDSGNQADLARMMNVAKIQNQNRAGQMHNRLHDKSLFHNSSRTGAGSKLLEDSMYDNNVDRISSNVHLIDQIGRKHPHLNNSHRSFGHGCDSGNIRDSQNGIEIDRASHEHVKRCQQDANKYNRQMDLDSVLQAFHDATGSFTKAALSMDGVDKNTCPLRNIQTANPIVAVNGKPVNCGSLEKASAEEVAESSADGTKPATKSAAKAVEKAVEKATGKTPEKAVEKAAGKTAEKAATKVADKAKAADKEVKKSDKKSPEDAAAKTEAKEEKAVKKAEKKEEKEEEKKAEKTDSLEDSIEKAVEAETKKAEKAAEKAANLDKKPEAKKEKPPAKLSKDPIGDAVNEGIREAIPEVKRMVKENILEGASALSGSSSVPAPTLAPQCTKENGCITGTAEVAAEIEDAKPAPVLSAETETENAVESTPAPTTSEMTVTTPSGKVAHIMNISQLDGQISFDAAFDRP